MEQKHADILTGIIDADSMAKLDALGNDKANEFIADAVAMCKPDKLIVCNDDPADIAMIRQAAIDNNEETPLAMEGHTLHFDGPSDQARDKKVTKYLVPQGEHLDEKLNCTEREGGLAELREIFTDSMIGKTMYVRFFCLGPLDSAFSISCLQLTDSAYVCHSEDMLYRAGYEQFKRISPDGEFFRYLHTAGRMENNVSVDVDNRRIYMDHTQNTVYSTNTQYAGNTVGLKKLSLRLAIRKADREGWLAEHMFIMGVKGPSDRVTYIAGAFPSACGKTSTAMLPGETIVGDDLAYFKAIDGKAIAVNVESGIFGIISDVNADDDPVIFDVLTSPGEVIFGNVLVKDGVPAWMGMGVDLPADGTNYQGAWTSDMTDVNPSHKNARYTVRINSLANADVKADAPDGVELGAIVYGGRDSDISVPVQQSYDWAHGIMIGASLESETTAATLGAEGVRTFNPMSNMDFLSMPLSQYIGNNLDFAGKLDAEPMIFGVNYFLKKDGKFLNGKLDKGIWVKWMELRVHGEVEAIPSPTGLIPKHEDLARLFKQYRDFDYTEQMYVDQFTIRIPENLAKLDRIGEIYAGTPNTPAALTDAMDAQRKRLTDVQAEKGDYVSPLDL